MWTSIGSLPYAARFVTAGLIGKDIILSGAIAIPILIQFMQL